VSELIVIAVPGRRRHPNGDVSLAAVIVPRLTGSGHTLADFGMDDWPTLLRAAQFHAELRATDGVRRVPIEPAFDAGANEMLANWRAMFVEPRTDSEAAEGAGFVEPHVLPPGSTQPAEVDIFDTGTEVSTIRAVYSAAMSGADWAAELDELRPLLRRRSRRSDLARTAPRDDADPQATRPDFHQRVAYLREHPRVLRAVGLIVDFTVAVDTEIGAIRVDLTLPVWPAGTAPTVSRPWTRCRVDAGRVTVEPRRPNRIRAGLIDLSGAGVAGASSNPDWSLVTFDVDNAMLHLSSSERDDRAELPRLRSAGIVLVRNGRAAELLERINDSPNLGTPADGVDLCIEDLTLGYRFDVEEDDGTWRSLCTRQASYEISGRFLDGPDGHVEEGQVKPDAMLMDPNTFALQGDELVVKWDGWSLAAPKPSPEHRETPARTSPTNLSWRFTAVGPLPRLRFGRSYRLRARIADLAGGGVTVADLADGVQDPLATDQVEYLRVEPVPAPLVTIAGPLGHGAAVHRLVVRSAGGPPPPPVILPEKIDPLLIPENVANLLGEAVIGSARVQPEPVDTAKMFNASDRRILQPPPVSLELADQHGVFDELSPEESWPLARRAIPGISDGPRLPDPMASGWVVSTPGVPRLEAAWKAAPVDTGHIAVPVAIDLAAGAGVTASVVGDGEGIIITLPPGHKLDAQVSSAPDDAARARLALPTWTADDARDSMTAEVEDGGHAHITPAETLHLVHAVQKPLVAPLCSFSVSRDAGSTVARVSAGTFRADVATTAHLDIHAEWQEWGSSPHPIGSRSAHVGKLPAPVDGPWANGTFLQEFGDTRRRKVTYTPVAVSRFQEYFDPALAAGDPSAFSVNGVPVALDVPSSARPAEPVINLAMPAVSWDGEPPGPGWRTWRHTRRGGRIRLHLRSSWFSSGEGELLGVVVAKDPFPAAQLWPHLSQTGRDPVFGTSNPAHWITAATVAGASDVPTDVFLPEADGSITIVPFKPWVDRDNPGQWLAEIDLGAVTRSSYTPFVELALVRYQPASIRGMHLSPVVRSDVVQLQPDRQVVVAREGNVAVTTLSGIGPANPNTVEVWFERWNAPAGEQAPTPSPYFLSLDQPGVDASVRAWVRVPGGRAEGVLGQPIPLLVPAGAPETIRLVVRERENHQKPFFDSNPVADELVNRVVFADAVRIR
jgi:hypothetical protein